MKKRSLSILIATCIACGSTPQAIAYYPELAAALLLIVAPHVGLKRQEHQQKQLFKKLQEESSTDSYGTSCGLIHPHIIIETALHRSGFFVSKVYENKNYK